jgi:protein TonB
LVIPVLLALAPPPPVAVVNTAPPAVLVPVHPSHPAIRAPVSTPPVLARVPDPRLPAQAYLRAEDYPATALANREAGRVAFVLDVGPNGRVHGCRVTHSSGSAALDSATCRIMVRRARFSPAIDSNGQPASASVAESVEWRLPPGEERG